MRSREVRRGFVSLSTLLAIHLLASPSHAAWLAAAGKADITPDLAHETVWLAGFGAAGRRPKGVHDPLYVRALVVSDGRKTVALVAVDSIGLYRNDVLEMRRDLGWDGKDKYLFVSAIHDHSAPDSLGLWGRFPAVSGVNEAYRRRVIAAVAGLVKDLSSRLKPADLSAASAQLNPRGVCRDSRDPIVIDPELDAVQVKARGSKKTIGTLVRWSCHPEVGWDDNDFVTADYPGALCGFIEKKTGGACVFQSGIIGGLLTPDADRTGGVPQEFKEVERIGGTVAQAALKALDHADPVLGNLSFKSEIVLLPVENSRYLLALPHLTFGHALRDRDGRPIENSKAYWLALRQLLFYPLPEESRPWVETEASLIQIGPVKILGIPGELFPELALGGYDGRYSFGYPLIKPDNPNPPNVAAAPKGPYLREKVGAKVGILIGLANDEIGYIVPNYDFKIANGRFMLPRLPGDHYEETNSIGPSATPILLKAFDRLLKERN